MTELIETVASDLYEKTEVSHNGVVATWAASGRHKQNTYRQLATIALAAVNTSGTHWIAPVKCPLEFGRIIVMRTNLDPDDTWEAAHDAYRYDFRVLELAGEQT